MKGFTGYVRKVGERRAGGGVLVSVALCSGQEVGQRSEPTRRTREGWIEKCNGKEMHW